MIVLLNRSPGALLFPKQLEKNMASLNLIFGSVLGRNIPSSGIATLYKCLTVTKAYSMYNPRFVDPVFKKEKQEEMFESGEIDTYLHSPIKAAKVDVTCSVFHDELVRKFTNLVMKDGRKNLARRLVDLTFEKVKRIQLEKYNSTDDEEQKALIVTDPLKIFYTAMANSKPVLHLTPIRRGGVTYQVPVPISDKRSQFMAMKWFILAGRDRERKTQFHKILAWELVEAAENKGQVVKKKQDLHRQCEANRAYAHYRWS